MPTKTRAPRGDERTEEITGSNATMDEAEIGTAGNGSDFYGGDFSSGGVPTALQAEPDEPGDILPDGIQQLMESAEPVEGERELSAQPNDQVPIESGELP